MYKINKQFLVNKLNKPLSDSPSPLPHRVFIPGVTPLIAALSHVTHTHPRYQHNTHERFFFLPPFLSDKAQRRDRVSICNLHMCVRQKGENGSRNQTRSFPAGPAPKLDMPTSNRNFEALNGTDCCLLFGPRSLGQPFSEGDKWNEIKIPIELRVFCLNPETQYSRCPVMWLK